MASQSDALRIMLAGDAWDHIEAGASFGGHCARPQQYHGGPDLGVSGLRPLHQLPAPHNRLVGLPVVHPRNPARNPQSPQTVNFRASIIVVNMGN